MQTYEFDTTVNDGVIQIPDEYKNKIGFRIKVMIMNDEPIAEDYNSLFPPVADTTTWKFDREEANGR